MMTHELMKEVLLGFSDSWIDYPFGEGTAVYKVGQDKSQAKMFALVQEDSKPLRVSLKCDPQLAELLREKYETVLPGYHLNKKHWNTIICSGQVGDDELQDLIRHSFELVNPTV